MTYVSYLHMEKAYRQPTRSESISIDTIEESVTLPSDPIVVTNEEEYEDIDDSATVVGEAPGEGESYESPEGEEADDFDDASSVASSNYQRGTCIISNESMVPTSRNIECGSSKSQQRLTDPSTARKAGEQTSTVEQKRHHSDPGRKPKHVSNLNEQQSLMSSTPGDSEEEEEEEERAPKLPLKNYKTTTV
jgi:hypothetical protein